MNAWDYLDFELEISEGGPRRYAIAVRSPAGEAQGHMRFPFDEWELKDRLQALEIALLRSGGTRRRIASPEEDTVQEFGKGLFESLLVGDVRTRYEMSLGEARRQGKGLRLKLRIQPSELAVLPWEFLYDAERDRYPSLSSNTPLVRYLDLPQPVEPLQVSPPLRVLGMVTNPTGLEPLDIEHEKRLVEEGIRGLRQRGLLELTWLEGQTWRHLMRAMRLGPWHIFHFIGHGGFDPATEEGALALSNEAGRMHLLRARGLAELLDDHYPLRLVFLNSCEGARGSESDAFSSTAATLVRRGVPAVVAMQYEITDKAAIEFSRAFYDALADGLPVDAAVTEARAAVSMDSVLEWGTPVLYMHSPDGRVFDVAAPSAQPPPESPRDEDQERRYLEAVEAAWAGGYLEADDATRLGELAREDLSLSRATAAEIERQVMGGTVESVLGSQEDALRQRRRKSRLEGLYVEARGLHQKREWQAVIEAIDRLHAEEPEYPDPEGLLASSREALKLEQRTAALYERGLRLADAEEWRQALECFEEVHLLQPGYRDTEELLSQGRRVLAQPLTEEVPDPTGGSVSEERHKDSTYAEAGTVRERAALAQPQLPVSVGSWWVLAAKGLLLAVFGAVLLITEIITQHTGMRFRLLGTALLFSECALSIIDANTSSGHRRMLIFQGRVSGVLGALLLLVLLTKDTSILDEIQVGLKGLVVHQIEDWSIGPRLFGLWALSIGAVRVLAALRLGRRTADSLLLGASGALLACAGVVCWLKILMSWPLLGSLLLASGIALVAVALRARRGPS